MPRDERGRRTCGRRRRYYCPPSTGRDCEQEARRRRAGGGAATVLDGQVQLVDEATRRIAEPLGQLLEHLPAAVQIVGALQDGALRREVVPQPCGGVR